jgi:hypothetical protein
MRKGLVKEIGKRKKFTAVFSRIGKKLNFKGHSEETILLKNIADLATGIIVADHIWFAYTKGFVKAALQLGDTIEFEARVKEYHKGYVNRNYGINHSAKDLKLANPTQIRRTKPTG